MNFSWCFFMEEFLKHVWLLHRLYNIKCVHDLESIKNHFGELDGFWWRILLQMKVLVCLAFNERMWYKFLVRVEAAKSETLSDLSEFSGSSNMLWYANFHLSITFEINFCLRLYDYNAYAYAMYSQCMLIKLCICSFASSWHGFYVYLISDVD